MKQIIPFVKDIKLEPKVYDITSISLEHDLKLENNDSIVGEFSINGKYKINNTSLNVESFELNLPFDITLDDKYDAKKVSIDIDDFYYEIINEMYLRVHIDVLVDNLVYLKKEEKKAIIEERIVKEPIIEEEEEILTTIIDEELKNVFNSNKERNNDIMDSEVNDNLNENEKRNINITTDFTNQEDKYITYKVHILRENETIELVMDKYNITRDELKKYNDLENVIVGAKVIIPSYE